MFALEEPKSRKRQRCSQEPGDTGPEPIAKKQKALSESRAQRRQRSPSFWDTLSKVRLSRAALREFDRRDVQETGQSCNTPQSDVEYPTERVRQRLKRFARCGGPDLSHLRGFSSMPLPAADDMSQYSSSRGRKRSSAASSRPSGSTKTSTITTKSGNFEQKMIDNSIYPELHEHTDGRPSQKPANLNDILTALPVSRASLSPSRFTDEDFEAFQRANARSKGETTGLYNALPFITGNETNHRFEADLPLNNLAPFDKGLSDPKPDLYYGANPSAIHPRVRNDLGPYIIPSKADTSRPAAPNFFLEGKSATGRPDVAKRQALLDGAIGARAMHQLQNYGVDEPVYDDKAYSYPCTYQDGHLQIYATHLTKPLIPEGQPEYHMTKLTAFAMTGSKESFIKGAAAYRGIRDRAKTERDAFIDQANQVARQMPAPSRVRSTAVVDGSDTSEDELARNEVTPVKRLRPSATPSASFDSGTLDFSTEYYVNVRTQWTAICGRKYFEGFNDPHTERNGCIFKEQTFRTSLGNPKACSSRDDVVKHVQWLTLLRSVYAMRISRISRSSIRVSLPSCQIRNGPITSKVDDWLSTTLV